MKTIIDYLVNEFGIEISTSVSIVVTIFVFCSGFIVNAFIKSYNNYLTRKRSKELFRQLLTRLEKILLIHANAYKRTSKKMIFENDSAFTFLRGELYVNDLFYEIGYKNFFEAFFIGFENVFYFNKKLRLKVFYRIWEALKTTTFRHELTYEEGEKFIERYNLDNKHRNDSIVEYKLRLEKLHFEVKTNQYSEREKNYISDLDKTFIEWSLTNNRTRPDVIHRKLVIKSRIISKKYYELKLSTELTNILLDATIHYINQRKSLEMIRDHIYDSYLIFLDRSETLKTSMIVLETNYFTKSHLLKKLRKQKNSFVPSLFPRSSLN